MKEVLNGRRPKVNSFYVQELEEIVCKSWSHEQSKRPSFQDIINDLSPLQSTKQYINEQEFERK